MRKRDTAKNGAPSSNPLLRRFAIRTRTRDRLAAFPIDVAVPPINLPFPTFGGKQIWADHFVCAGWRIQRNHYTGHHRLLDPNNFRRAWGNYAHCHDFFDRYRKRKAIQPRNGHLIILVHGLGRSADAFREMEDALRGEGYETASINYPSTRQSVTEHANSLENIVSSLDQIESISFVTHSMGALVVRELLSRDGPWRDRINVQRIVMIAPPNQGSRLAARLSGLPAYRWLTGQSGQNLSPDTAARLPVPEAEFGIIAGGRGNDLGFNPLLPGDDDGFVSVEETRLDGARDFMLVRTTHGLMDDHPQTIDATISFLRDGQFLNSADSAQR
jgi:pimeloyl-ACP methyl ester carboxylesterase